MNTALRPSVRALTVRALAVCALAGCASVDPYAHAPIDVHLQRSDEVGDCARLFRAADAHVDRAGVRDAQATRVPGFPYLRVDRLAESLGDKAAALPAGFSPWSELMAWLDRDGRAAEFANVAGAGDAGDARLPLAALDACRYRLAVADEARLADLRRAARVPDDYATWKRVLGLYPITRLAFAAGIRHWHDETRAVFQAPQKTGSSGVRYVPGGVDGAPAVPQSWALGLPQRSAAQWVQLLSQHAPRLVVETVSDDDRIGRLVWQRHDNDWRVHVDTSVPVAYTRVAFTRFGDQVVAQLVYTFWFPARPPESGFDLLAGPLDGIVWRVTLDREFKPLVYDTIHPCGCYHLFFPTERVRARPQPQTLDEGMFAPLTVSAPKAGERTVLHVAARTHYLTRIATEADSEVAGAAYEILMDDALRRLPLAATGRTHSVYGPDGLIAGSERAERFFFWPMGIASAGQMRQWGRHATAFVGRRHFDEAWLFDRYFAIVSDAPGAGPPGGDLEAGER